MSSFEQRLVRVEAAWARVAETAAQSRDGARVRAAGEALEKCGELREQLAATASALHELEADVGTSPGPPSNPRHSAVSAPRADRHARAHAIAARKGLVSALESAGVQMERESEAVYRTSAGSRVAMPFSRELEPGKWWLGSYMGRFDEVLLLCEVSGSTIAFHLDHAFVRERVPRMSRDSSGNVKFNVERVDGDFKLRLPKGRLLDLRRFEPTEYARTIRP